MIHLYDFSRQNTIEAIKWGHLYSNIYRVAEQRKRIPPKLNVPKGGNELKPHHINRGSADRRFAMPPAQAPPGGGGAAWRRLLLLLTVLPLTLATLAFVLQWRGGGVDDPTARWPPHAFPGMAEPARLSLPSSDCSDVLAGSSGASFPYLRGWSFPTDSGAGLGLQPKVCVQTSTSAGLEQILPWLFYHKVVGVAQFLLFVEGRAAKPNVAGVLESIPVGDIPSALLFSALAVQC